MTGEPDGRLRGSRSADAERASFRGRLTVGLDYRSALRPNPSGVGRYVRDLVAGLAASEDGQRYTLLHDEGRDTPVPTGSQSCGYGSLRIFRQNGLRQIWEEVWLPAAVARLGLDICHSPNATPPLLLPPRVALVVTVHDVIHRVLPATRGRSYRLRLDIGLRRTAQRADAIIVDSQSTARDFARYYGASNVNPQVIYPGVSSLFSPMSRDDTRRWVEQRFRVLRPYLLYVGGFDRRKNVLTLLNAYAALREHHSDQLDFIIAGSTGTTGELEDFVRVKGLKEVVHFPGYVSDEELVPLYSAAAVFAYPSLYEGFGYPVVEAMACGAPVVCSNTSSLPEVAGTAGILVDPESVKGWVRALRSVLAVSDRTAIQRAGQAQAGRFTFEAAARATRVAYVQAYQRATEGPPGRKRNGLRRRCR